METPEGAGVPAANDQDETDGPITVGLRVVEIPAGMASNANNTDVTPVERHHKARGYEGEEDAVL